MLILNVMSKELIVMRKIMLHTPQNMNHIFLAVLLTKFFVLIIDLAGSQAEVILKEYDYCKKIKKHLKHFNQVVNAGYAINYLM